MLETPTRKRFPPNLSCVRDLFLTVFVRWIYQLNGGDSRLLFGEWKSLLINEYMKMTLQGRPLPVIVIITPVKPIYFRPFVYIGPISFPNCFLLGPPCSKNFLSTSFSRSVDNHFVENAGDLDHLEECFLAQFPSRKNLVQHGCVGRFEFLGPRVICCIQGMTSCPLHRGYNYEYCKDPYEATSKMEWYRGF